VARSLVSAGTDVNAKDDMGRTAIHLAALPREIVDKSTITYLLSQGADINTKDIEGLTPYELAKKNKKYTLILILDAYVIRR
jgi:serine/threonine-protein phosphatase 6 regulatory ankyrin repeat subunit A